MLNGQKNPATSLAARWVRWLDYIEDGMLVLLLASMTTLAALQVILRNLSNSGFIWGEPILHLLVLWLGLLGAMVATRQDKHIAVDALLRILPPIGQRLALVFTKLATAMICGVLAYYSGKLVALDYQYQDMLVEHVPAWAAEIIMPVAFSVMSLRFLLQAVMPSRESA